MKNDPVGWAATDLAWQITEDTKFINNFGGTGNSKRVQLDNTTALTLNRSFHYGHQQVPDPTR